MRALLLVLILPAALALVLVSRLDPVGETPRPSEVAETTTTSVTCWKAETPAGFAQGCERTDLTSTTTSPSTTLLAPSTSVPAAPIVQSQGDVWARLAACESGGRWDIHDSLHSGGLQFAPPTWLAYGGAEYAPMAHQATQAQQIDVARRVLRVQGPTAWPTCGRRVGLTKENGR